MSTKENNNEIVYINIIKIFACLMVIINHTSHFILEYNTPFNNTFFCLIFSLCKVGVPLFLLITGTLIIHKDYSYKKILKCIIRVFIPLFILSFFIYIKEGNRNFLYFISAFFKEPFYYTYWYIYMLIGLYLTIPFLQKMVKKFEKNDYLYFLTFFLLIPSIIRTLNLYVTDSFSSLFLVSCFPVAIGIVICGDYLSKIKLNKKNFIIAVILFIVFFVLQFLSMCIPYLKEKNISYTLDIWDSFPVIVMGESIFYIFRYLFENVKFSDKTAKIMSSISTTIFGVYLIHELVVKYVYSSVLFNFCPLIGQIVLYFGVFMLSSFFVYILKKSSYYILKKIGLN